MGVPYKENKQGIRAKEFIEKAIEFEKQHRVEAPSDSERIRKLESKYWDDYVEY